MKNSKLGVSPVIGAVMLFAMLIMLLALFQSQLVPSMCKNQEERNAALIEKSLEKLANELSEGKSTSAVIESVHYQKYPFLYFPPSPPITVELIPYTMHISYNTSFGRRTFNITNTRIVVKTYYFYYPQIEYVYENGALFEIENNITMVKIPPENKSLTIIDGEKYTVTSNSAIPVRFTLNSEGSFYAKNLTITFNSICPEGWKNYAYVSGNTVKIVIKNVKIYVYRYAQNSEEYEANLTLLPLSNTNISLALNQSITLSVKAVDENLMTAIPGVRVNVSVKNGIVSSRELTTNSEGIATTTFTAEKTGNAEVVFNASGRVVTYHITVREIPSFYTTKWINKGGTVYGYAYNEIPLYVKVTKNGLPVANALVYFGVNNSSVAELIGYYTKSMGYTIYSYTNSSGIAKVYLEPIQNGSVEVYCYSGGSGDEITLRVVVLNQRGMM